MLTGRLGGAGASSISKGLMLASPAIASDTAQIGLVIAGVCVLGSILNYQNTVWLRTDGHAPWGHPL